MEGRKELFKVVNWNNSKDSERVGKESRKNLNFWILKNSRKSKRGMGSGRMRGNKRWSFFYTIRAIEVEFNKNLTGT